MKPRATRSESANRWLNAACTGACVSVAVLAWGCGGDGGGGGGRPTLPDSTGTTDAPNNGSDGAEEETASSADIEILSPLAGACVAAEVQVAVRSTLSGSLLRLTWADKEWVGFEPGPEPGVWVMALDLGPIPEGAITLRVDGHSSLAAPQEVGIFNDKSPPVVQLLSPAAGDLIIGEAPLKLTAFDNSACGFKSLDVQVWADSAESPVLSIPMGESAPIAEWEIDTIVDLSAVPTGAYRLRVVARDAAGWSTSAERNVDVVKGLSYTASIAVNHGISGPRRLRAGDHDGDGLDDVYVAGSGGLSVVRSRDHKRFWEPIIIQKSDAHAVEVVDLDDDGQPEIMLFERTQQKIWLRVFKIGEGSDVEIVQSVELGSDAPTQTALADLNGDGAADLVWSTASPQFSVGVLLGAATQKNGVPFATAPQWAGGLSGARSLSIADFNADSKLDVLVGSKGNNKVSVFLGVGDGSFLAAADTLVEADPVAVAPVPVLGSPHLGLAVASESNGVYRILKGHGDGYFEAQTGPDGIITMGGGPSAIRVIPLGPDGFPHLAMTFSGAHTINVCPVGTPYCKLTSYVSGPSPIDFAQGRFVSAHPHSLAVLNASRTSFTLIPARADGTLLSGVSLLTPLERQAKQQQGVLPLKGANLTSMAVGQFDGKPGLDVIAIAELYRYEGEEWVYDVYMYPTEGELPRTGFERLTRVPGTWPHFPAGDFTPKVKGKLTKLLTGDFDGNGLTDLLVAHATAWPVSVDQDNPPGNLDVLLQLSPGTMSAMESSFVGRVAGMGVGDAYKSSAIKTAVVARFDADKLDDVAVAVPWTTNTEGKTPAELVTGISKDTYFEQLDQLSPVDTTALVDPGTEMLLAADVNRDGNVDLVSVNLKVDSLGFHYGDGTGRFAPAQLSANVAPKVAVVKIDQLNPDEDNLADLISVGSSQVYASFGVPNAGALAAFPFTPPTAWPYPGKKAESIVTADLNGDGLADLAVADSSSASLIVFLNIGKRQFSAQTIELQTRAAPREVVAADLDEDGCLDLVVRDAGGMTVFRNESCD